MMPRWLAGGAGGEGEEMAGTRGRRHAARAPYDA